jgi:cell cycle related kinase
MPYDLGMLIGDVDHPMTMNTIRSYTLQLCYAIAHLHHFHIMHRDLKPANLLISATGNLRVSDMGQARLFHDNNNRPYSHQVGRFEKQNRPVYLIGLNSLV